MRRRHGKLSSVAHNLGESGVAPAPVRAGAANRDKLATALHKSGANLPTVIYDASRPRTDLKWNTAGQLNNQRAGANYDPHVYTGMSFPLDLGAGNRIPNPTCHANCALSIRVRSITP